MVFRTALALWWHDHIWLLFYKIVLSKLMISIKWRKKQQLIKWVTKIVVLHVLFSDMMHNSGTQLIIKPQADLYFDYICTNLKYQKSILINISMLISGKFHSPNWMHIAYLSIYLSIFREKTLSTVAISLLWKRLKTRRLLGVAPLGCCSMKCRWRSCWVTTVHVKRAEMLRPTAAGQHYGPIEK